MRTLFITQRFYPEIGGVEKHCYMVSQELAKHGIQVSVITGTLDQTLMPKEQLGNLPIHRIFFKNKHRMPPLSMLNIIKAWLFLLKNLRLIFQSDTIHLHDSQTFLWLSPFIPFVRRKAFITFHGFESYPIHNYRKVIRKIAEKILDGSICVGKFIVKWYGAKPDYITLGGTEINIEKSSFGNDNGAVFVGRLANDTGILDLITALGILKSKYHFKFPLHICGDGPLRKIIQQEIEKLGLEIYLHGFIPTPNDLIVKCRYAFLSGYLSILEAMAYKKPVFALYSNPLKRDYLYSFPNAEKLMIIASSPEDLADKIFAMMNNPEETDLLIERAYKFVSQQTWANVACLYLKLYQDGVPH
jgi:glycosyltransferase involved in cell wall biosynthesis